MAVVKIPVEEFIALTLVHPVIDVRSPAEFCHAQVPSAHSIPLFNNDERAVVGTAYKQQSRQAAIKIGLQLFGPKMVPMVEQVEKIVASGPGSEGNDVAANASNKKTVLTYCWRGGMRSAGVSWLLDLYGFKVYTLIGGYKAFRNWVLQQFGESYPLSIMGGYTGSDKTGILQELRRSGKTVIDLEGLAHHKGSAFGSIGMPPQPSQEMFENRLALELWKIGRTGATPAIAGNLAEKITSPAIWLEDESQRIGNLNIPPAFWKTMRSSPMVFLDVPFEYRLQHIVEEYGNADPEDIAHAIARIRKRLGGLEAKRAADFLASGDIRSCFSILLAYYDKYYKRGLDKRTPTTSLVKELKTGSSSTEENARLILQHYD